MGKNKSFITCTQYYYYYYYVCHTIALQRYNKNVIFIWEIVYVSVVRNNEFPETIKICTIMRTCHTHNMIIYY